MGNNTKPLSSFCDQVFERYLTTLQQYHEFHEKKEDDVYKRIIELTFFRMNDK